MRAERKRNLLASDIALMATVHFVALQQLPSRGPDVMRIAGGTDLGRKRRLKKFFAAQRVLRNVKLGAQDG